MYSNLEFIKDHGDVSMWRLKKSGYYRVCVEPRSGGYISTYKTLEEAEEAFQHYCRVCEEEEK